MKRLPIAGADLGGVRGNSNKSQSKINKNNKKPDWLITFIVPFKRKKYTVNTTPPNFLSSSPQATYSLSTKVSKNNTYLDWVNIGEKKIYHAYVKTFRASSSYVILQWSPLLNTNLISRKIDQLLIISLKLAVTFEKFAFDSAESKNSGRKFGFKPWWKRS